ncbi:MAG: hypothetical protein AB1555_06410 [Nitrospirota bacterium]
MLRIHVLTYDTSLFIICAACGQRTQNRYLGGYTLAISCPRCQKEAEWKLEEVYWSGLPQQTEKDIVATPGFVNLANTGG